MVIGLKSIKRLRITVGGFLRNFFLQITLISAIPFLLHGGAPKEEDVLKKHEDMYKPTKKALDTLEVQQMTALVGAHQRYLTDENGEIDYDRLDTGILNDKGQVIRTADEVRRDIREHVVDYLAENHSVAKKLLSKIDDKDLRKRVVEGLAGYNDSYMESQQKEYGAAGTAKTFIHEVLPRMQQVEREKLEDLSVEHITADHIEKIIKDMGINTYHSASLDDVKKLLKMRSRNKGILGGDGARSILKDNYKGMKDKSKKNH
jgi:hypothetical protein